MSRRDLGLPIYWVAIPLPILLLPWLLAVATERNSHRPIDLGHAFVTRRLDSAPA